jgi:hypothetical protein
VARRMRTLPHKATQSDGLARQNSPRCLPLKQVEQAMICHETHTCLTGATTGAPITKDTSSARTFFDQSRSRQSPRQTVQGTLRGKR